MTQIGEARNLAPNRQIRVMLVDDHEIMRDGLREVLQRAGDYEVVGQAGDGEAAVRVAQSLRPDVIIMDVTMPIKNGIDACRGDHGGATGHEGADVDGSIGGGRGN